MARIKYIKKGQCIWCLKKEPDVTFYKKPHTISKQLGATKIGFDICDSCNFFLGTADKSQKHPMSVELAFKEILNVMRLLLKNDFNENTHKSFKSIYFNYFHSKNVIHIRNSFKSNPYFLSSLTRQFIKGTYETFLQEYHRVTENALNKEFDPIRNFVRYDKGNLPLYFMESNGVYLIEEDIDNPSFSINENNISEINDFGFFMTWLFSNVFFLEVTPRAEIARDVFLKRESGKLIGSGSIYTALRKMRYITDLDFTLRKLHNKI